MGTLSVNKVAGLSLVLGPLVAFIFFLIQPGRLLIDSADISSPADSIIAAAGNAALSNITAMVIALGLITTVYGFYVLQSRVGTSGNGKALAQYGFLLLLIGNIGWILAQGLTFMLADAQSQQAVAAATSVYLAQSGIILLSGLAIAMGYMLFSLALSTRADFNKPAALIVALVSVVVLVCYIIGISDNSQLRHHDHHSQVLLRRLGAVADYARSKSCDGQLAFLW